MTFAGSLLRRALPGRGPRPAGIALLLSLSAGPVCADAFDRTWCELDTGEFRLTTDHSREAAEAMARLLHAFRPIAEDYLTGSPNPRTPPLSIVVFSRVRDFRRAMGGSQMVGFMQPSFAGSQMVVGPDPNAYRDTESLLHEYVHYLLRTRTDINIPAWYDEGLAGMLSSARQDGGQMRLGELPAARLAKGIDEGGITVAEVLVAEDVWDWPQRRIRGFYDLSRVLVHRLLFGQEEGRQDLRAALATYLSGDATSLSAALDVSAAGFDRRLERYLDRDPPAVVRATSDTLAGPLEYRCLDDSEKTRRIALAIVFHHPELAVERLAGRLEADPDNAALWTALSVAEEGVDDRDAALTAARRAAELAPANTEAAVRVASSLVMGCILRVSEECRGRWQEAVPLLRSALERDPTQQEAIFVLGLAYLYSGRAGDALNYLRIAHSRQPWSPPLNFYLGESYRIIGDHRAEEYLQRARRWSPTELWRRLAEAALDVLHANS